MKTARFFAMAFLAVASVSLIAQDASTSESQKTVYATQGPMGFGDASASHSWEMSTVSCELQNKLDSKTARVGDRVVLRTNEKVQTADGTVIPRGTRLVGHITELQTHDASHGIAQLAIAFDRAELKNGQSISIFTLIRGVSPPANVSEMSRRSNADLSNADPMGATNPGAGGRGGRNGGGPPGVLSDDMQRTSPVTGTPSDRASAEQNSPGAVELAGHGDTNETPSAHQAAAARAIPHATAIPGVMLAGNSAASGVFLARQKDIEFESGTQVQLGIVADR
jgi:hypothetical protein